MSDEHLSSERFIDHLKRKGVVLSDRKKYRIVSVAPQNGKRTKVTFKETYHKYCFLHIPTLSLSSQVMKLRRCDRFTKPILNLKMQDFTSEVMNEFIIYIKDLHIKYYNQTKKYNFDKQLKDLKSILNWYAENYDASFYNPVKRSHFRLGILAEIPKKEREISLDEINNFFSHLKQPYKDMATIQLYCAGRIGEISGIHLKNINLEKKQLLIKEVLVWIRGKVVIKEFPKNGEARTVHINETMEKIFTKYLNKTTKDCPLLFRTSCAKQVH